MKMENYPRYYRKMGRCIRRNDDLTGVEVRIPDTPGEKLPLMMDNVTYPSKQRFDEDVAKLEEVDLSCFEDYVYGFIGRVEMDISRPMTERAIKKQLEVNKAMQKI